MKKLEKFDLEVYKANPTKKVVTRDGRPVRILATDLAGPYPLAVAFQEDDKSEELMRMFPSGAFYTGTESYRDLFFEVESKEYWVNVYYDSVFDSVYAGTARSSEEEARRHIDKSPEMKHLTTIKIWEE